MREEEERQTAAADRRTAALEAIRIEELKAKGVQLLTQEPKSGHGGSRIAFIDPVSTGNVLIELAELPAGH